MTAALDALYQAIRERLARPGYLWADRVYPDLAPAHASQPLVVFHYQGGGEANRVVGRDAEIVLTVKCIAGTGAEAFEGAGQISQALNDRGAQDQPGDDDVLDAPSPWQILTATEESAVHLTEYFADAAPVYHRGAQFRFVMEVTS